MLFSYEMSIFDPIRQCRSQLSFVEFWGVKIDNVIRLLHGIKQDGVNF